MLIGSSIGFTLPVIDIESSLVPLKIILANGFPKVSYFILSNEKMGISKGPLKKSKYEIKNWFVSFDRLPKPLLDITKKRS